MISFKKVILINFLLIIVNSKVGLTQIFKCCKFQSQFDILSGECSENKNKTLLFPKNFTVPKNLSISTYKASSFNLVIDSESRRPNNCNNKEEKLISVSQSFDLVNFDAVLNFTQDGFLRYKNDYIPKEHYCLNSLNDTSLSVVLCNSSCSTIDGVSNNENKCLRKCCDFGQVWDMGGPRLKCKSSGDLEWKPEIFSSSDLDMSLNSSIRFTIDHPRNGWCKPEWAVVWSLNPYRNKTALFRVLSNGKIMQKIRPKTWSRIAYDFSCIDGAQNYENSNKSFDGKLKSTIVLDCSPPIQEEKPKGLSILYGILMIISCFFLAVTVGVHLALWEKQNVHTLTLVCYSISLLITYILFVINHFSQNLNFLQTEAYDNGISSCQAIGIALHFFFIHTFCWLLMINYDLWQTFRSLNPSARNLKGYKKLCYYFSFSLIFSFSIVTTGLVLDIKFRGDLESDLIIPLYGQERCYVESHWPMLIYVYTPIGILTLCNLILFTMMLFALRQIKKTTKFARSSSSSNKAHNQSLILFIKLFTIAGVCWISEIISYFVSGDSVEWYWAIFDFINIFQAIFIFIIFVCKSETIESLKQKYTSFKKIWSWVENTFSCLRSKTVSNARAQNSSSKFGEKSSNLTELSRMSSLT